MKIAVVGCFQNGKSTLINCLLGGLFAKTGGEGLSETSKNTSYKLNDDVELIDTPGFNANQSDTKTALLGLDEVEAALVVITNRTVSEQEKNILFEIDKKGLPFVLVMNCMQTGGDATWNPLSDYNRQKVKEVEHYIGNYGLLPFKLDNDSVIAVNLKWYWYHIGGIEKEEENKREDSMKNLLFYKNENPDTDFCGQSNVAKIAYFLTYGFDALRLNYKLNFTLRREMVNLLKVAKKKRYVKDCIG